MPRRANMSMVTVFAGLLVLVLGATVALPKPTVSKLENRDLATTPRPTLKGMVSGSYFQGWDTYLVDHVAYRESWVRAYAFITMRVLGKPDMAGVIVGKRGRLLERPDVAPPSRSSIKKQAEDGARRLSRLAGYAKNNGTKRFLFVGVPTPESALRNDFPAYFPFSKGPTELSSEYFYPALERRGIRSLDLIGPFKAHDVERLYLQTDHHWTLEGAFVGYTAMMRSLGFRPRNRSSWEFVDVPNQFQGSRNRQVGYAFETTEHIQIARRSEGLRGVPCTITIDGKGPRPMYAVRDDPSLPTSYMVYLTGDTGEVVIETGRPELPDLLIFGDSYMRALVPFAYTHFNTTRVIDLRHYDRMSLYSYIRKHTPEYVVMLTFSVPPPSTGIGAFGKPPRSASASASAGASTTPSAARP